MDRLCSSFVGGIKRLPVRLELRRLSRIESAILREPLVLESLFDLPLLITGPAIVGSLCLYALVGLVAVRRYVLPRLSRCCRP